MVLNRNFNSGIQPATSAEAKSRDGIISSLSAGTKGNRENGGE